MRIVSYYEADSGSGNRAARLGVVTRDGVVDAGMDAASFFAGGEAAYERLASSAASSASGGAAADSSGAGAVVGDLESLRLAPTVPNPGKILCIGLNYRRHAAESGMAEPKEPVLFSKFNNTLAPHGAAVNIAGLQQVDYESELAVVIGRGGKDIEEAKALDHVLGYLNSNDISERELQMRSGQWLLGKSVDGFLPLGPLLVTADEAGDPQDMRVRGWLNGDLRQDSNTADMIFSVAEIIAYVSRFMTLDPGDVILTGTPEGVVLGRPQKDWVVPGDVYEVEVGGLGRLTTRFV